MIQWISHARISNLSWAGKNPKDITKTAPLGEGSRFFSTLLRVLFGICNPVRNPCFMAFENESTSNQAWMHVCVVLIKENDERSLTFRLLIYYLRMQNEASRHRFLCRCWNFLLVVHDFCCITRRVTVSMKLRGSNDERTLTGTKVDILHIICRSWYLLELLALS